MQVILLERVAKLGQMGEVVDVKPGYARNYLLPQGKALSASKANVDAFEARKAQLEADNLESRKEAEKLAETSIHDNQSILSTAKTLRDLGASSVVIKGGHSFVDETNHAPTPGSINDFFIDGKVLHSRIFSFIKYS